MATYDLHDEFIETHKRIALGNRALVAIAAHVEVRSVLRASTALVAHDLDDVLIGSYARRVAIWPGKDVDVFGRLSGETTASMNPDVAYSLFETALARFAAEGRLTPQPRSLKIDYSPDRAPQPQFIRAAAREYQWAESRVAAVLGDLRNVAFEFSVDVVPAVLWGADFGIPETDRQPQTGERQRTGRWRKTNPIELTARTRHLNQTLSVGGRGAYVPTVRAVKQVKAHHLPGAKPSSLYYEFVLHEGFARGRITGSSWADVIASALTFVSERLGTGASEPVRDPVLREPYGPAPSATELAAACAVFDDAARRARRALTSDRCQAALEWRAVFGSNVKNDPVFPLPPGCRGSGTALGGAAAVNLATGGVHEKSFGDR
jgi:hypothetical protein